MIAVRWRLQVAFYVRARVPYGLSPLWQLVHVHNTFGTLWRGK